jgi:OHCU decarboxylase
LAAEQLLAVCHSRRWAGAVADRRPFADLAAVQSVADDLWQSMEPGDWREALAGHPRIGEQGGSSKEFSRAEQAGLTGIDDAVKAAIAQGNDEYEERFGHVFLISAAGRSPAEILENLRSRLGNDAATELVVAAEQHRRITRLRLEKMFG